MAYAYLLADPFLYSKLKEFAKENRRRPTDAESALWIFLKNNGLGKAFKRQFIIGQYIADFACLEAKLIVEIDGGYHQLPQQQTSDEERQQWLETQGFTVIRFTNEEVIGDIENVLETIEQYL